MCDQTQVGRFVRAKDACVRLLVPALVSTVLASVGVLAVGEASAQRQDAATDAAPAIRTGDINRIEVEPNHVELTGPFSYQQLLVTGWTDEGEQIDLTREAVFQLEQSLVQISTSGLVQGSHDGATDAIVSAAGQRVQLPIHVDGLGTTDPPDFLRDIMPVLSRVGCNAGTCHGSQAGKNGFKLSLRGYDPLQDHRALTDDLAARRVNLSAPRRSLMLLKPAGIVPHEGGAVCARTIDTTTCYVAGLLVERNLQPKVAGFHVSRLSPNRLSFPSRVCCSKFASLRRWRTDRNAM